MTRGRRLVAVAAALAAAPAALPPAAEARTVRVFAVGPKFDLAWLDTRQHFRDKLFALVDRGQRTGTAPAVQPGADDVASHRLGPEDPARPVETARDLVALPEDLGLLAALTGPRGAGARSVTAETGGLTAAIGSLVASYGPVNAYYARKFPEAASRGVPTRLLGVALTDTFARVAVESFAELADRYDVWLEAGINMVQDWQVVCSDRDSYRPPPGAGPCAEEDPGKVAQLRDPSEPERTYAYEATSDRFSNIGLIFDPAGRLVSKQVKTYITPVELPGQLDLVPGEVSRGLTALETPVGRLGVVTSKDAWMPDVTAKLDQRHADVLVQPEFFVNDTVRTEGMWAPDNLKASGYSDLLRHPSLEALVLPELTGNVYDFSADAQQHIGLKPRSRQAPAGHLVGQDPAPGLVEVQPWSVPDPVRPGEPMPERRRRLGEAGERMLPREGSPPCPSAEPGPCRGGQVEGVLHADVELGERPFRRARLRRTRRGQPFGPNRPISRSGLPQRNVTLAMRGHRVWAAFEERRAGRDQVLLSARRYGRGRWSRPIRPTGRAPGAADEWWPSLAIGPRGKLWLAWQDDSTGTHRAYYASSSDGGRTFSPPRALDATPPPGVLQWKPSIAAVGEGAVAAWVDERDRVQGEPLPRARIRFARLTEAGPEPSRVLDAGEPVELARPLSHTWAPSVAARGDRVLVTWVDFRNYDWDVFARESGDGGRTFGPEAAVNDTPAKDEALADTPRAAVTDRGPLVAWTDYRKRDSSARTPHQLYDTFVARPGGTNRQVDPHSDAQVSTFSPAILPIPGDQALVAWQDMAGGPGDIRIARVKSLAPPRRAWRVDDTGFSGWNQWRPALARSATRLVAAWEDERDGPPQVYAATGRTGRVR